jgi:uncharacterized repeat protein (TIGR03803 family)
MNYKKFLGAAGSALMIVIVVTLVLASSAWAQSTFKTLYTFKGGNKDGGLPTAGVILDAAGNLYGTVEVGGGHSSGAVFELTPGAGGWTKHVLHVFTGTDGAHPDASLTLDAAGNLYGTTGCCGYLGHGLSEPGVVFELTPNSDGTWVERTLYKFTGGTDGGTPNGSLIFDQGGNLYGTTMYGGIIGLCDHQYGCGVVFELTPNSDGTWTEKVLHSFAWTDGAHLAASLTFDHVGNLYGTTTQGGNYGGGVVFKLTPNSDGSWTENALHSFTGGKDGSYVRAGLTFDAAGNLYGATRLGGNYGVGVVF